MANPAVTYIFANSTTADATQVNQDFTDLINGITDGTKDLSISALTCAGTATLNGNTIIGNSSVDTLTISAVLASSIALGTTFSYEIGSATVGLKSVYLGSNDSAARSVRLIAGATSASYTITIPTATASQTGMTLVSDASSVWTYRYTEKTAAKTTTYTATGDETVITCTTGSPWTLTLPAAASFPGKHFYIKKTSSDTNVLTVDGNASETIDGQLTLKICSQYDFAKIVSDGSNWHLVTDNIICVAKYSASGTRTPTTSKAVNYDTLISDTHTSVTTASGDASGWKFTAQRPGRYLVVVHFFVSVGSASSTNYVYINGVQNSAMGSSVTSGTVASASTVSSLAVGDFIDIRTDATPTFGSAASLNQISILRVGN